MKCLLLRLHCLSVLPSVNSWLNLARTDDVWGGDLSFKRISASGVHLYLFDTTHGKDHVVIQLKIGLVIDLAQSASLLLKHLHHVATCMCIN